MWQAVLTKPRRLAASTTQTFLTVLEAGTFKTRMPAGVVAGDALWRAASHLFVLPGGREGAALTGRTPAPHVESPGEGPASNYRCVWDQGSNIWIWGRHKRPVLGKEQNRRVALVSED